MKTIVGKTYNRIEVIEDLGMIYPNETSKRKDRYCIAKCHCGNKWKIRFNSLKKRIGCGCHKDKGIISHPAYSVLANMKQRCYDKNSIGFKHWGGRGIKVCDKWLNDSLSFLRWCDANGYQKGLDIDRINNDGNYEPSNCRFVSRTINNRNQSKKKSNTSGFIGVYMLKNNKYESYITVNKKRLHLGTFDKPQDAAIERDRFIIMNDLIGFNTQLL
jgi:hypothetical protein